MQEGEAVQAAACRKGGTIDENRDPFTGRVRGAKYVYLVTSRFDEGRDGSQFGD